MAHRFSLRPSVDTRASVSSESLRVSPVATPKLPELPARVTPAMVTEAADTVLRTIEPQHADVVRRLWTNDSQTDVARLLFQSEIAERAKSNFVNWDKPTLHINETLDADQTARCTAYVPEYQLVFRNSIKHDHPMFAAGRRIDHQLLMSKFPPGMRYADIGGNVMFHVMRGDEKCVVIAPDVDDKDPQRRMLSDLRLKRVAEGTESGPREGGFDPAVKRMAVSVLAGEGKYVVRDKAEVAKGVHVRVSISCHVYDIAIEKWPYIMENIGSSMHEGCLHFSNVFFEQSSGALEFSGARYVIDRERDEFSMGLGASKANWYTHKWSDFMKYGANQILYGYHRVYSYQITERRGDTLFFRILEMDPSAVQDRRQVYRLPSVECVEVNGFAVGQRRKTSFVPNSLVPRTYVFPEKLWGTMLSYAKMELTRGGLDYNKMFNFYRTAVPRQSINSVTVSGGEKVPIEEVPALIVMAAAVAAADVIVMQQSLDAVTREIGKHRDASQELSMLKLVNTLFETVKTLGLLAVSPFAWLGIAIEAQYLDRAKASLVSWRPQVSVKRFPYSVLADVSNIQYDYLPPKDIGFSGYLLGRPVGELMNVVEQDPRIARDVLDICGQSLPPSVVSRLRASADPVVREEVPSVSPAVAVVPNVVESDMQSEAPTYVTTLSADLVKQRRVSRRNAIHEGIIESELEGKKLQAACGLWYRRLFSGSRPNKRALHDYAEEMGNPDIWRVENGVLVSSELGQEPDDFQHSGVYTVLPDPNTQSHLRAVSDTMWEGMDRVSGKQVSRKHFFIAQSGFTGYALTLDELKIFNGPEIRETLQEALSMPDEAFDTKVIVHQGPPGCGKTTSIVKRFDYTTDMVLCPVRESLNDTRKKILERSPELTEKMLRDVTKTTDALLVNWQRFKKKGLQFDVALGDECYITHSAKWYASMALLGVREFHGYGDKHQIAHVARVDVPQAYTRLVPDVTEETWITYRCAPEILAMWNGVYNDRVRSMTKWSGRVIRLTDYRDLKLKMTRDGKPDYLVLTMYQADKKVVQAGIRGVVRSRVMTTHEGQGKQAGQIVLVNFEVRVRTADDSFYLFYRDSYVNVALSRAREEFVYVKQSKAPDLAVQWMERASDPRRVAVAKEVSSAGVSKPFLT